MQVAEIDRVASPGNAGRVLRDTQNLQTAVGCLVRHLLNGAVGVSTGYGMGMYI